MRRLVSRRAPLEALTCGCTVRLLLAAEAMRRLVDRVPHARATRVLPGRQLSRAQLRRTSARRAEALRSELLVAATTGACIPVCFLLHAMHC